MNESKYKTVFVEGVPVGRGLKFKVSMNGDQLARDMQATIEEMEQNGFELFNNTTISGFGGGGVNTNLGMMMVFKKRDGK